VSKFKPIKFFAKNGKYQLLPFRFAPLDGGRVLATNIAGEYLVTDRENLTQLIHHQLNPNSDAYRKFRLKSFLTDDATSFALETLPIKIASRMAALPRFTGLHMFVVTLRCEHSCPYCQVSRQSENKVDFDMTIAIADKAIDVMFKSPSPDLKVEFQGGEPLLNFPLIQYIVHKIKELNEQIYRKKISFVIATNLALLSDEILEFCAQHNIDISTSLDGPMDLHNANRPRPGGNSYQLTIDGITKVRKALGPDKVSALMTTTISSLPRVKDIIDEYIKQGFDNIFLRSLSPYGFAIKTKAYQRYQTKQWLKFYTEGLEYIIHLNKAGFRFYETYTQIILQKMLTFEPSGYVDLMSPSGMGIAGVVYNYDGDVYASDEGRMLAETGDREFCIGNVLTDDYSSIFLSDALLDPLEDSFAKSSPMCEECAFEDFCGSDPIYHYATQGDVVGHKAISGFCEKNMSIFKYLIQLMEDDKEVREIFRTWIQRC